MSRHTFPWTPGAPLRLPRRFCLVRSIVAALCFRIRPTWNPAGVHFWFHQPSPRQLLPDSLLRSPLLLPGGGLPTQACGPLTASHRMTRACPQVEPAPHTEQMEISRLRAELARVTMERDILGKATAYFAKGRSEVRLHPTPPARLADLGAVPGARRQRRRLSRTLGAAGQGSPSGGT